MRETTVIVGVGGMGLACARRIGSGQRLVLADFNQQQLKSVATPADRYGKPENIAAAVEWLAGLNASFVSGIDLRVDGGMVAAVRWADHKC